MAPQAPWTLPPELAAHPASPAPPLDSSNSSSASSTNLLPQTPTPQNAAVGGPDGRAARMRARTSPSKSLTHSATSPRRPTGRNDLSFQFFIINFICVISVLCSLLITIFTATPYVNQLSYLALKHISIGTPKPLDYILLPT